MGIGNVIGGKYDTQKRTQEIEEEKTSYTIYYNAMLRKWILTSKEDGDIIRSKFKDTMESAGKTLCHFDKPSTLKVFKQNGKLGYERKYGFRDSSSEDEDEQEEE